MNPSQRGFHQNTKALILRHKFKRPETQEWVYPFYGKDVSGDELCEWLDFQEELATFAQAATAKNEEYLELLNRDVFSLLMTMADRFLVDFTYPNGEKQDMRSAEPEYVCYACGEIYSGLEMLVILSQDDLVCL